MNMQGKIVIAGFDSDRLQLDAIRTDVMAGL